MRGWGCWTHDMGRSMAVGCKVVSRRAGACFHQQDLTVIIITHSILFSLILASILLFVWLAI